MVACLCACVGVLGRKSGVPAPLGAAWQVTNGWDESHSEDGFCGYRLGLVPYVSF